jgi:hypothetical protein
VSRFVAARLAEHGPKNETPLITHVPVPSWLLKQAYRGTARLWRQADQRISGFMDIEKVTTLLRAECKRAGGAKAWAAKNGPSAQYVSDVLVGRREPGPAILVPLGLRKVVAYQRIKREKPNG